MANEKAVLFLGSNRPIIGREQEAMGFWMEAGAFFDNAMKQGYCTRWDGFWLTPHGSDLNAAFTCYGERAKLDEWRRTDEFEAWVFRASACLENLRVVPGVNFAAGAEAMARRSKVIGTK